MAVNAKTNINSAPFEELWRAFWSVMSDVPNNTITPGNIRKGTSPAVFTNGAKDDLMFRSTLRDPRPTAATTASPNGFIRPTPQHMLEIRSALAAVNAIDLRDGDDDITSREIPIYNMTTNGANGTQTVAYRVRVYGNERQPFITKVYYDGYAQQLTDDDLKNATFVPNSSHFMVKAQNPKGYVAVELYNPYPTPMQLNRWAIGVVSKKDATSYTITPSSAVASLHIQRLTPRITAMPVATFDEHYLNQVDPSTGLTTKGQVLIPAQGYALLENYPCLALEKTLGSVQHN